MTKIIDSDLFGRLGWLVCALAGLGGLALGAQTVRSADRAAIVIEWSTESELDIAGYNLLRGVAPEGPFTRINPQVIPPSEDSLTGGDYAYEDTDLQAGVTYYYLLEDIEVSGGVNQHGPVAQTARSNSWMYLLLSGILVLSAGSCAWMQTRRPPRDAGEPDKLSSDVRI